jgi:hypothetical protein
MRRWPPVIGRPAGREGAGGSHARVPWTSDRGLDPVNMVEREPFGLDHGGRPRNPTSLSGRGRAGFRLRAKEGYRTHERSRTGRFGRAPGALGSAPGLGCWGWPLPPEGPRRDAWRMPPGHRPGILRGGPDRGRGRFGATDRRARGFPLCPLGVRVAAPVGVHRGFGVPGTDPTKTLLTLRLVEAGFVGSSAIRAAWVSRRGVRGGRDLPVMARLAAIRTFKAVGGYHGAGSDHAGRDPRWAGRPAAAAG